MREIPSYRKEHQQTCFAMRLFISVKREKECFAENFDKVDKELFPVDLENVAHEQQKDKGLLIKFKKDKQKYKTEVRQDVELITYEGRVYIPPCLRGNVLNWCYHYLRHVPGLGGPKTEKLILRDPKRTLNI